MSSKMTNNYTKSMEKLSFSKIFQNSGNDFETTFGSCISIGKITERGANASAILWSSYVFIM